jgi:protein-tyrosine phosphatase
MGFMDVHGHFLPGVDDGPATLAGALAAVRTAVEGGTSVAFATPHVTPALPFTAERREELARRHAGLVDALDRERLPLDLRLGYEVTPWADIFAVDPRALCLGDLPYVLVDCPFMGWRDEVTAFVERVRAHGLTPILAHPERNDLIQTDLSRLDSLRRRVVLQVNASSLLGVHGPRARAAATELVVRGWAQLIASDGHGGQERPHRIDTAYLVARDLVGGHALDLVTGVALGYEPEQRAS